MRILLPAIGLFSLLAIGLPMAGCQAKSATVPTESSPTTGSSPTVFDDFAAVDGRWHIDERIAGGIAFGVAASGASDGVALRLALPGDASKGPAVDVGPSAGNQIQTSETLSYGTYRFRLQAAGCTANLARPEEVVTGAFVYAYGGDVNGNGMTDNNEIDFEVVCSAPHLLSIGVWTDYDETSESGRSTARVINMRTGDFTTSGREPTPANREGTIGGVADPAFDATAGFREMGFTWSPGGVTFFFAAPGGDVVLWEMTDATYVPHPPAPFFFNVWHSDWVWHVSHDLYLAQGTEEVPAFYPQADADVFVDWFEYWQR